MKRGIPSSAFLIAFGCIFIASPIHFVNGGYSQQERLRAKMEETEDDYQSYDQEAKRSGHTTGCDELYCSNGGYCDTNINGTAACQCPSGFMGKTCELEGYTLSKEDMANGLKIDIKNDNVNETKNEVDYAIEHGHGFQGDMWLTKDQLTEINETKGDRALMTSVANWPHNRQNTKHIVNIPYVIKDINVYSKKEREHIARAVEEFEINTCIRIVPWNGESDYIEITYEAGCFSRLGKIG